MGSFLNWFYIAIRTFPFWGIPVGVVLLLQGLKHKNKKKLLFLGIFLIFSGVTFLFLRGPFLAVPFLHEVMNHDLGRDIANDFAE
jgi:hypothetical protein